MIKIEHVEVMNWDAAIRGMRNALESWHKSDSYWTHIEDAETQETAKYQFFLGDNDFALAQKLANAGPDHGKFLRYIIVSLDITAPLYWYKEFDTYKVGTVANSCSTMHKIHSKEITLDDFSHEHMDTFSRNTLRLIADRMETARKLFLAESDKKHWWQIIQLLPSSYNQRRTITLNYAVLRNMYHARKHHKLDEWREFCAWIESLPYAELITGGATA